MEVVARKLQWSEIERTLVPEGTSVGLAQPSATVQTVSPKQWKQLSLLPDYDMPKAPRHSFTATQEWEGTVIRVESDKLFARLIDLTNVSTRQEEEDAEVPLEEVQSGDRVLVKPGAVFRLAVGYQKTAGGSHHRIANLVFRRLPQWTKREIAEADAAAMRSFNAIQME